MAVTFEQAVRETLIALHGADHPMFAYWLRAHHEAIAVANELKRQLELLLGITQQFCGSGVRSFDRMPLALASNRPSATGRPRPPEFASHCTHLAGAVQCSVEPR